MKTMPHTSSLCLALAAVSAMFALAVASGRSTDSLQAPRTALRSLLDSDDDFDPIAIGAEFEDYQEQIKEGEAELEDCPAFDSGSRICAYNGARELNLMALDGVNENDPYFQPISAKAPQDCMDSIAARSHANGGLWFDDPGEGTLCYLYCISESTKVEVAFDRDGALLLPCAYYIKESGGERLRLVGGEGGPGESSWSGRLEVKVLEKWGTVCSGGVDLQDDATATAVCSMMGFDSGEFTELEAGQAGAEGQLIALDGVKCAGGEGDILLCDHSGIGFSQCSHADDVGLSCSMATVLEPGVETPAVATPVDETPMEGTPVEAADKDAAAGDGESADPTPVEEEPTGSTTDSPVPTPNATAGEPSESSSTPDADAAGSADEEATGASSAPSVDADVDNESASEADDAEAPTGQGDGRPDPAADVPVTSVQESETINAAGQLAAGVVSAIAVAIAAAVAL